MARLTERIARIARGETKRTFALFDTQNLTLLHIPLNAIQPDPSQPRREMGDLEGLQASIAEHGLLQPLIVSPEGQEQYRIIAGERRYTAARALDLDTVPALVRTVEEHQRLALQLVENLHRKDLNPLEEAQSYQRLLHDYNLTQEEVGRRVGKSVAAINQSLRLLTLPQSIQLEFQTSEIPSKSVLLEISKQKTDADKKALWEQAKRGDLTVKQARQQKVPRTYASTTPQKTFRYPIHLPDVVITLVFDRSTATAREIVEVLEQALEGEKARL